MHAIWGRCFGGTIVGIVSASILVWPTMGTENVKPIPDFSGVWWRNAMDPELPASGSKPLVNLMRQENDPHPNGGGDPLPLVGDYNTPILKPKAAEAVKKAGELSAGGRINPDPSNQCAPFSPPYIFTIQPVLFTEPAKMSDGCSAKPPFDS